MWQEERGKKFYRFQTDNREIANNLKRRKNFKLVGCGVNCKLWIFQSTFSRPDIARKTFQNITKGEIEFDAREEVLFSTSKLSDSHNKAA
jgi:hypothetical protein